MLGIAAHGVRAVVLGHKEPVGTKHCGLPAFLALRRHRRRLGHASRGQHALSTEACRRRALDWSFHVLPVFSYGANPNGYYWNVLFGLAGYERNGQYAYVKTLWLPITVDSPKTVAGGRTAGSVER